MSIELITLIILLSIVILPVFLIGCLAIYVYFRPDQFISLNW